MVLKGGDWEELADWYDQKQGETGDLWHRALIDPVLLRLVGDVQGKDLLDLGCGNGYLARKIARHGARVTAVDSSRRMIENAQHHDPENELKILYFEAGANRIDFLQGGSFDTVYANMSLMDIEDAEGAISQVSRVLRISGKFIASISHPCFDNGSKNSCWLIEHAPLESTFYRKIRAYRIPFPNRSPWRIPETNKVQFTTDYHRPLSWYARMLKNVGLAITDLEEPEPTQEFVEKEADAPGFMEIPLHLVIGAIKI
jgi:ubiquinone/menaquinone biosynthesis C-methylase UbiE